MPGSVTCARCGVSILPGTAAKNNGVCMPCKTGTREAIERGRRYQAEERERERSDPFRTYWRQLVTRVYQVENGFETLTAPEQLYFAVCVLEGEVFNGGFDQYFFNSSGALYETALRGLQELGAWQSLTILRKAKAAAFPRKPIPGANAERRRQLRAASSPKLTALLSALDTEFWADPDGLGARLEAFARKQGLVS